MVKKLIISAIFTILICNFAKANSAETSSERKNINRTDCTWESSQFKKFVYEYTLKNTNYLNETIRYCVDYKNKTVFSFKNSNVFSKSERVYGFLNSGELKTSDFGYHFIYQFEVEDDKLVRYSCRADGPKTYECINNEQIGKWIYGVKR